MLTKLDIYVFICALSASGVGHGFESRSGKTKTIKLVFAVSQLITQYYGARAETGLLGIRIMCLSGATCISTDYCLSELALS